MNFEVTNFLKNARTGLFLAIGMCSFWCSSLIAQESTSEPAQTDSKAKSDSEESPIEPEAPAPWILRPYEVQVQIAVADDPEFIWQHDDHFFEDVRKLIRGELHQMWNLEIVPAESVNWFAPEQLENLSGKAIKENFSSTTFDKVLLVTVSHQTGQFTIAAREWDSSSQSLSSYHEKHARDHRQITAQVASIVLQAFRPFGELETISEDGDTAEFLIRGGEYLPRNKARMQFQPGDFLVPYFRYLDRQREVQRIQVLPWTFLKVDSVNRSRIEVSTISTFRSPLSGTRRRVEVMGMRIRPHLQFTEVLIYPRGDKLNPLVGYRCEVMSRVPSEDDPVEDRIKLVTDRRGIATVPANPEFVVQYLYVYSGKALLAKVPLVPGYAPRLELEVPDDRHRLNVEGEVALMQSELIDIVSTREVLMARVRNAVEKKQWDDVSKFMTQIQELATDEDFKIRIEALQVRAVYEARQARDRVAEIRVKRLCDGIREASTKHLDPFKIVDFRREIDEIRRTGS